LTAGVIDTACKFIAIPKYSADSGTPVVIFPPLSITPAKDFRACTKNRVKMIHEKNLK
jgi:hypothetical protein